MPMKKNDLEILCEKIKSAKRILIAGHKNPDGDALCSGLALAQLIRLNFGRDAVCVYEGNVSNMLDNVPMRNQMHFHGHVDLSDAFDLVFVLDYGAKKNLEWIMPVVNGAKFVVAIDHHKNPDDVGDMNFNNDSAAATAQIIFDIAKKLKWARAAALNTLIAVAILTDTGFFKYERRGDVLRVMAQLVDDGVNIEYLSNLLNNMSRKTILTESAVASRAEFFFNGRLALATVDSRDYKRLDGRGETVLSLLGQIKGVEYIVLLKQQKEKQTGVSIRSRSKPINEIAVVLGGGGHAYAAGAVVNDTLENVRAQVLEIFRGIK